VTYAIQVTNIGTIPAPNVILFDVLPASSTFVSVAPATPACTLPGGQRLMACDLGTLGAGETARINLAVAAPRPGTIVNGAVVTTGIVDANPANNEAVTQTMVR
jgi:large repetitive protein